MSFAPSDTSETVYLNCPCCDGPPPPPRPPEICGCPGLTFDSYQEALALLEELPVDLTLNLLRLDVVWRWDEFPLCLPFGYLDGAIPLPVSIPLKREVPIKLGFFGEVLWEGAISGLSSAIFPILGQPTLLPVFWERGAKVLMCYPISDNEFPNSPPGEAKLFALFITLRAFVYLGFGPPPGNPFEVPGWRVLKLYHCALGGPDDDFRWTFGFLEAAQSPCAVPNNRVPWQPIDTLFVTGGFPPNPPGPFCPADCPQELYPVAEVFE